MNKLISHPFELQLNTWFISLEERLLESPVATGGWLETALGTLKEKKARFLSRYRCGLALEEEYRELTFEAGELLQEILVEEGPTDYAWLNKPYHQISRFLSGQDLNPRLPEYLKSAVSQVPVQNPSLRQELMNLLLWSEGHRTMTGMEIRNSCERLLSLSHSQAGVEGWELDLFTLWSLSRHQGGESYLEAFFEALQSWEADFLDFEELVLELLPQRAQDLNAVADILYSLTEGLEEESWDVSFLELQLQALKSIWNEVSTDLLPLLTLELDNQSGCGLPEHLRSLTDLAAGFQSGQVSETEFKSEVRLHQERWNFAALQLSQQWSGQKEKGNMLTAVSTTLAALDTVNSPGDARLGPLVSIYCQSLVKLLGDN